jgi:hypothetical protein
MSTTTQSAPTAASLAAATKADRNRAVDLYRVIAMVAVAVGHWLAMVAVSDNGEMVAGNALEFVPSLSWATWLLQVMPLFFVVGGFSSAISLDAHNRANGRPQDWIAARFRRMLPPAVTLAGVWLVAVGIGTAVGQTELAIQGAAAAAIPLWFLANYTIDTALAPFVLPRFRRNPVAFGGLILGSFLFFEALRIADVAALPQINWVLGWLSFQMLGMAWRDGLLPTGRRLVAIAGGFWVAALTAVLSGGPWAISMVNFPGMENSPTNPPTLSLLLFGTAYSLTAIHFAPAISAWLAERPKAWAAVIGANTVAMSVYLWHMTAAIIVTAAVQMTVGLPEVMVGSAAWWYLKIPMVLASMLVLAPIVVLVSGVERRALLAPRRPWNGSVASIAATAVVTSAALKLWTSGQPALIVGSCLILVALGSTTLRPTKTN